jgi:hypothetical protein
MMASENVCVCVCVTTGVMATSKVCWLKRNSLADTQCMKSANVFTYLAATANGAGNTVGHD